jgi:hypothetical protein
MATVKAFIADNLFVGQDPAFLEAFMDLASAAENVRPRITSEWKLQRTVGSPSGLPLANATGLREPLPECPATPQCVVSS